MMPEIDTFGPEAIQGAMQDAMVPNPLAQALQAAPKSVMGPVMGKYFENAMFPKTEEPFTLSPGQIRYGPGGQQIASVPASSEDKDRLLSMMSAAGIDPASPQGQAMLRDWITKQTTHAPPVSIQNYGSPVAGVDAQGNPVFFQPSKAGGQPSIVPGIAPPPPPSEPLSREGAGAATMLQQAIKDIDIAMGLMYDEKGNLKKDVIAKAFMPGAVGIAGVGTDARKLYSTILNAIEAKLRVETGAAATQPEIDRLMARFAPSVLDDAETVKFKMDRLKDFMRGGVSGMGIKPADEAGAKQQAPGGALTPDERNRLEELRRKHRK
jgi:hypothetical protein